MRYPPIRYFALLLIILAAPVAGIISVLVPSLTEHLIGVGGIIIHIFKITLFMLVLILMGAATGLAVSQFCQLTEKLHAIFDEHNNGRDRTMLIDRSERLSKNIIYGLIGWHLMLYLSLIVFYFYAGSIEAMKPAIDGLIGHGKAAFILVTTEVFMGALSAIPIAWRENKFLMTKPDHWRG